MNPGFQNRVFPLVLQDAGIHDPVRIVQYVKHWEEQIEQLDQAMKQVEGANLQGIRETLDLYREIRATIGRLTDILADMNHLSTEEHVESDFAELAGSIEVRI